MMRISHVLALVKYTLSQPQASPRWWVVESRWWEDLLRQSQRRHWAVVPVHKKLGLHHGVTLPQHLNAASIQETPRLFLDSLYIFLKNTRDHARRPFWTPGSTSCYIQPRSKAKRKGHCSRSRLQRACYSPRWVMIHSLLSLAVVLMMLKKCRRKLPVKKSKPRRRNWIRNDDRGLRFWLCAQNINQRLKLYWHKHYFLQMPINVWI